VSIKKRHPVLPFDFSNSKDILTIFGAEDNQSNAETGCIKIIHCTYFSERKLEVWQFWLHYKFSFSE